MICIQYSVFYNYVLESKDMLHATSDDLFTVQYVFYNYVLESRDMLHATDDASFE